MRRRQVLVFVAALLGTGCGQAAAVRAGGSWGRAIEVPGLGALNKGRNADVSSVSCASPGYCAAGGYYGNHGSNPYLATSGRGFVVSEKSGRWGRAVEVPGLGARPWRAGAIKTRICLLSMVLARQIGDASLARISADGCYA